MFGLVIHIMISSHLIPFEEASLKLEELPQAVRLAEQLGDRKLRKGGFLCCMMVTKKTSSFLLGGAHSSWRGN